MYGTLPSYRAILDHGGAANPGDAAAVGQRGGAGRGTRPPRGGWGDAVQCSDLPARSRAGRRGRANTWLIGRGLGTADPADRSGIDAGSTMAGVLLDARAAGRMPALLHVQGRRKRVALHACASAVQGWGRGEQPGRVTPVWVTMMRRLPTIRSTTRCRRERRSGSRRRPRFRFHGTRRFRQAVRRRRSTRPTYVPGLR